MNRNINNSSKIKSRFIVIAIITIFLFMFAQLGVFSIYGTKGDDLTKILNEQKQLDLENQKLESQINGAESMKRIEEVAVIKLGLKKVEQIRNINISDNISLNN